MIQIRRSPLKKTAKKKPEDKQTSSEDIPLSKQLNENLDFFRSLYKDSSDVMFRSFLIGDRDASIIYIEGLSDVEKLDEFVLNKLMNKNEIDMTNLVILKEFFAHFEFKKHYYVQAMYRGYCKWQPGPAD